MIVHVVQFIFSQKLFLNVNFNLENSHKIVVSSIDASSQFSLAQSSKLKLN